MKTDDNQIKRWMLPRPVNNVEIFNCPINYTLQKVLSRRGYDLEDELDEFLTPSVLPNPNEHFSDLNKTSNRIIEACKNNEKIAICGDYDADGITSTVLLVELLNKLGAEAISFIPSRQDDGYGLNIKMINELYIKDIKLAITVDNGVSAFEAIKRSKQLGIDLIITDHHKIPGRKADIYSLIHPETTPTKSPYKYLSGVGIAYMLAKNICNKLNYDIDATTANVLFCIGTVADMAPLIGANRKWLKECLPKIHTTTNIGIREIIKKLSIDYCDITSEDIGYKIAPLINAVGRIGDTNLIIDLLTSSSEISAKKITNKCFAINKERKRITSLTENEAIKIAFKEYENNYKFLVISKREWNPGIIGIVAARILDKFNLPTAIISAADDGIFRGSIRSNNLLKVNLALDEIQDILITYGGHPAAAGFTIKEEDIHELKERLNNIAIREMKNVDVTKSIKPDAYISFVDINYDFYMQLILLGPFGIMNPTPIFWTRKCRVLEVNNLKGKHLKMTVDDGTGFIEGIKWNNTTNLEKNDLIDIAFYIEMNKWNDKKTIQLNIIDIKKYSNSIELQLHQNIYKCQLIDNMVVKITNNKGKSIRSDLSLINQKQTEKEFIFSKKIIGFAEIALGKAA